VGGVKKMRKDKENKNKWNWSFYIGENKIKLSMAAIEHKK